MLELIAAIVFAIVSVLAVVVGTGEISEKEKKNAEKPQNNESLNDIPELEDLISAQEMLGYGTFNPVTGEIKSSGDLAESHEKFHKKHFISMYAPTKNMRRALDEEWSKNKNNLNELKRKISDTPTNTVGITVHALIDNANPYVAIIAKSPLNVSYVDAIRKTSNEFEAEKTVIEMSDPYIAARERYEKIYAELSMAEKELIGKFLDSETGRSEIRRSFYKDFGSSEKSNSEIHPRLLKLERERLKKNICFDLEKSNINNETFQKFLEFAGEHHKNELENVRKMMELSKTYESHMNEAHNALNSRYFEKINNITANMANDKEPDMYKNIIPSDLDEYGYLSEAFGSYPIPRKMQTIHPKLGETAKKAILDALLGVNYSKNEEDQKKYSVAFETVLRMADDFKRESGMNDDDVETAVLSSAKYFDSVENLEAFYNDKKSVAELGKYAKISQNIRMDKWHEQNNKNLLSDVFGEYIGAKALGRFKNRNSDLK